MTNPKSNAHRLMSSGQRGFTLIELLIVTGILAVLAGTIIPNVTSFLKSGRVEAASAELEAVRTAAIGYLANTGSWPTDSSQLSDLLVRSPNATYTFDPTTGYVYAVSNVGWAGINWSPPPGQSPYTEDGHWTR